MELFKSNGYIEIIQENSKTFVQPGEFVFHNHPQIKSRMA